MGTTRTERSAVAIDRIRVHALTFPTDGPEQDGTISWDSTTMILVEIEADGITGIGYSYGAAAGAELIRSELAGIVCGSDAMATARTWQSLQRAVRNIGRPGISAHAISAIDIALWDVKARLLDLP